MHLQITKPVLEIKCALPDYEVTISAKLFNKKRKQNPTFLWGFFHIISDPGEQGKGMLEGRLFQGQ